MKYSKFIEWYKLFSPECPDWGIALANEMVCGKTGDARYCGHYIKQDGYTKGKCSIGLNPIFMEDWECAKHTIVPKITEKPKKSETRKPNLSKWFDTKGI